MRYEYSEHTVLFEIYSNAILLCASYLVRKSVMIYQNNSEKRWPYEAYISFPFKTINKIIDIQMQVMHRQTSCKHTIQRVETYRNCGREAKTQNELSSSKHESRNIKQVCSKTNQGRRKLFLKDTACGLATPKVGIPAQV